MEFTTKGFFEVAIESWPERDLNPRPLNSVQTPHIHICFYCFLILCFYFHLLFLTLFATKHILQFTVFHTTSLQAAR